MTVDCGRLHQDVENSVKPLVSEMTATTPGKYTCLIEISAAGVQTGTRTVCFAVKGPATTGTTTITSGRGNAVWRRAEAIEKKFLALLTGVQQEPIWR